MTYSKIVHFRQKLQEQADAILQYVENMKEGVRRGMVRSVAECKAGIYAVKQEFLNISRFNETGISQFYYSIWQLLAESNLGLPSVNGVREIYTQHA